MSWLPDWFSGGDGGGQTFDEAQANYNRLKVKYAAQLQRRLDAGEISQAFYNNQLQAIRGELDNPDDAYWDGFLADVAAEARAIPGKIKETVGDTAQWVGETIGKTSSNLSGGLVKGLLSNFWSVGGAIVFIVVLVVIWKPVLKPILGKIKIIPI